MTTQNIYNRASYKSSKARRTGILRSERTSGYVIGEKFRSNTASQIFLKIQIRRFDGLSFQTSPRRKINMRIILIGSSGRMGRKIIQTARLRGHEIVAGVDKIDMNDHFPVFAKVKDINVEADMVVDFSHPHLLLDVLDFCEVRRIPLIYGTTDIGEDDDDSIYELSKVVPVVRSSNFSLGISVLKALVSKATKHFSGNYDISILDTGRQGASSPSPTAQILSYIISDESDDNCMIPISSVRGGTMAEEHEVIFAGDDEVIRISHGVYSDRVYATGALIAAEMIINKESGYYTMDRIADMIAGFEL